NFPEIKMPRDGACRLAVANRNMPDMVGQISHVLGQASANIKHMRNESRNGLAYTLIDLDGAIGEDVLQQIRNIEGVLNARQL
ncbi:MAG: 3-phosphoglycerate dehydrogenase, partial [Gammaproteobacteria bacterium]